MCNNLLMVHCRSRMVIAGEFKWHIQPPLKWTTQITQQIQHFSIRITNVINRTQYFICFSFTSAYILHIIWYFYPHHWHISCSVHSYEQNQDTISFQMFSRVHVKLTYGTFQLASRSRFVQVPKKHTLCCKENLFLYLAQMTIIVSSGLIDISRAIEQFRREQNKKCT